MLHDPSPGQTSPRSLPQTPANILLVAGEASGDLHAASLAAEIRAIDPSVSLFGVGGDRMEGAGVELLYHMRHLAVVGITEVARHLGDIRKALKTLTGAAVHRRIDALVLIDYPDFNLTLARRVRRRLPNLPIVYYISPQVWAWRSGRIKSIARLVDVMLVILPFEEDLYAATGLKTEFVGHPLLDVIELGTERQSYAVRHGLSAAMPWVGLLPGSRRIEVERLLPHMLAAADLLGADGGDGAERLEYLVPVSPTVDRQLYESLLGGAGVGERARLIENDYYATLEHCAAAVVCSGTATLEAALTDTPMVVVYRTSQLTYNLAKSLIRVRDIALVNLIAGRRAVPELVQGEVTGPRIAEELRTLLDNEACRAEISTVLAEVRRRLGSRGASRRAARAVLGATRPGAFDASPSAAAGEHPAAP